MKRVFYLFLLLPLFTSPLLSQSSDEQTGHVWKGGVVYVDEDMWFPLYVRLWEESQQLHALLDSPSEDRFGLEVRAVSLDDDAFHLERITANGELVELEGTLAGKVITGDFLRDGEKQGIFQLARSSEPVTPNQTNASYSSPRHSHNRSPREAWQRMPEIIDAMGVTEGATVAEVGAGDGWVTARLARRIGPEGTVYAVDIDENALRRLRNRVGNEGLTQVEVVHGDYDDPKLPEGQLDAVVMVNAYHEMDAHDSILRHVRSALKPEGRLVIVDNMSKSRRLEPRASQTSSHQLALHIAREDLERAGFEVVREEEDFVKLPRNWGANVQWILVAQP